MADFSAELEVNAKVDAALKALRGLKTNVDKLNKSKLSGLSSSLDKFGKSAKRVGSSLTSFAGTLGAAGFFGKIVADASNAEETVNKFNVVFQDVAQDSAKAAKDLARDFGLSQTAAKTLLGDTGDLLTGFGFSGESALDLSKNVQELAVDLASFTNFSGGAEGASAALTKALLGETESLKSLGIAINQDLVKKKVQELALKGVTFETEKQAKAQATFLLATEQSKNAVGDFARSSDSFANQSRILKARLSDISEELGKVLLPIATKAVKFIGDLVTAFSNAGSGVKIFAVALVGAIGFLGPAISILGTLATVIGVIVSPIGLVVAGIVAIGVGIALVIQRFLNLKNAGASTFDTLKILLLDFLEKGIQNLFAPLNLILSTIETLLELSNKFLGTSFEVPDLNIAPFKAQIESLRASILANANLKPEDVPDTVGTLIDSIKNGVSSALGIVNDETAKAGSSLENNLGNKGTAAADKTKKSVKKIGECLKKNKDEAKGFSEQLGELSIPSPADIGISAVNSAANGLAGAFNGIADGTKEAGAAFKDFANNFLKSIAEMILQATILKAIESTIDAFGSAATGGFVSGGQVTQRFAEGGEVRGKGSGTSDSIPARLSNGEFVSDAKTVSRFGVGFFKELKRAARGGTPSFLPSFNGAGRSGFADGGFVGGEGGDLFNNNNSSTASEPMSFQIVNQGGGKEVTDVQEARDAQGTVISIFLDDVRKNGPVTRNLSETFGLKRGTRK